MLAKIMIQFYLAQKDSLGILRCGKRKVPNQNAYIDVWKMFYFEDIVVQTHLTRATYRYWDFNRYRF